MLSAFFLLHSAICHLPSAIYYLPSRKVLGRLWKVVEGCGRMKELDG